MATPLQNLDIVHCTGTSRGALHNGGERPACGFLLELVLANGVGDHEVQDAEAAAVDEDGLEVLLAGQAREGSGGAVLHRRVRRVHHGVQDVVQHAPLYLVLQPLERLLHAVLRRLHPHMRTQTSVHSLAICCMHTQGACQMASAADTVHCCSLTR
jgi:hypothetical protein